MKKGIVIAMTLFLVAAGGLWAMGSSEDKSMDKTMDKSMDKGMGMAYTGYLMDKACGEPGKGMDGSDVVNAPQDHTKKCLIACSASGYGLSVKDGMAYKFVPFDDNGIKIAAMVAEKTTKDRAITVKVMGEMKGGMIVVTAIEEIASL